LTCAISSTTRRRRSGLGQVGVDGQDLVDLLAHPHQRVERGHRLLEDHAEQPAAPGPHRVLGEAEQVAAAQFHGCRRRPAPSAAAGP
jgi:hypothetical protein